MLNGCRKNMLCSLANKSVSSFSVNWHLLNINFVGMGYVREREGSGSANFTIETVDNRDCCTQSEVM